MKLARTYAFIKKDLSVIEETLEKTVYANQPLLQEAATQLLKAGGKRLRPIFLLLASQFGSYRLDQVKKAACSLELIHMASLVHDDVIDDSDVRRGKPTVKAKWDNQVAMLTGDFIFATALQQFTEIDNPKAHRVLSKTMIELTVGEIEQIKDKYNLHQNLRTYLRRIKRKTALLISSSCQIGAIVAGADKATEQALHNYGYYMGMSYQIIDDILDFTSSEKQLGKPAGSDLFQGNITLPALYAMDDQCIRQDLQTAFFDSENLDMSLLEPITSQIAKSDAIARARQLSDAYLQKAHNSLSSLPNNEAKEALENIANYIGNRKI
ncbi:heptaprenyl diphosphate synthase component II [Gracilibacillus alcaliphilus]|uniref:heptaprenyl diphosphate synthase component II n=1 Tax=Gracilibacillus alcaliphilus TaxID=1401441 RepID=UPI0019573929|nr:heptaprenyl diphosphate synthase component II [Gracilibacillus alcaliphilus]MBM7675189.1 heptaprenyl diphosphate synthase [Gracilibacillus alcaliphilus]